jgi:hypothetical protein
MERGSAFEAVHRQLLDTLANYVGRTEHSLDAAEMATIHVDLEKWFRQRAKPRQVFILCAITPWEHRGSRLAQ